MTIHMTRKVGTITLHRSIAGWVYKGYVIRKPLSYDLNGYNGSEPTVDAKDKHKWCVFKRLHPQPNPVAIVPTLKAAVKWARYDFMIEALSAGLPYKEG